MGTPLYESDGSFDDSGSSSPEERSKATSAHRSVPMAQRRTSQSEKRKSVDLEGLYRQAAHEFNEVDKICQARTMFAPTEDLERALALLYKWSEDVERLYGLEAANYLKRKSVANPAIVDRRKAELRRVLELRKLSGRREGNDAASSSTTTIAPDTDSALRPMSPSVVASATNTRISLSVPDSQSELFCNQCRRGPLSCMHSHRRVQKFFERGLEHATSEELDIVKRTLCNFISRGGNPFGIEPVHKYSKPKLQADEEHWLSQLEEFFNFQPYRRRASSPIDPSETMESRIPKKSRFYCQKCQKLRPDSCGHKRQKMKELSVIADKILSARDNNNNRSRIAQQQALYDTPNAGDFDIARRFLDDWSKRDEADYGLEHIQKERERGTGLLAEEAEWTRQFEQVIRLRKPSDSAWENTNGLGVSRRMSTSKDKGILSSYK